MKDSVTTISGFSGRQLAIVACVGALASGFIGHHLPRKPTLRSTSVVSPELRMMMAAQPSSLAGQDVAVVNMSCSEGLPAAEGLDLRRALITLDEWAARVREETERHLAKFRLHPAEFQNSEAYFRMLALVTVLQQDFGVRYNPERVRSPDFRDSRDLFLHGLLQGQGGTCVSMPVLYVAVGRRLGYPLKLVTAKAHLFARWESPDGKERLNLEATGQGLNCFPDEYYHRWPVPMAPQEIASGQYLKSLTPAEELAVFLSARGHCLEAAGRLAEAQVAHAHAHALAPQNPVYLAFLAAAVQKELPDWQRVQVDLGQAAQPNPGTRP
jgi:regulator of sirC expression with transglutaminase-like and TPR domain